MPSLIQITRKLDLEAIRRKLEGTSGPKFWNSLEQIAETPEFRAYVDDEFPERAMDWSDPSKRRTFLKLMGASLALAGITACTKQPPESIVPYVRQPEEFVPGKPLYYATTAPARGGAIGILVESHLGRPTKIEGNPQHPASLGAVDAITQASLLDLYDPDRSQALLHNGEISSWSNFAAFIVTLRDGFSASQGANVRILSRPVTSPSVAAMMQQFLTAYPSARWHQWDPVPAAPLGAVYHLENADVIVSLDADLLGQEPGALRYAHEFARKRRLLKGGAETMSRLYAIESTLTNTGGMADHRVRLKPSEIPGFAGALAAAVRGGSAGQPAIAAIAKDLDAHRGTSLVAAGQFQPAAVHAAAQRINEALGNTGKTVDYLAPLAYQPVNGVESLRQLVNDINAGEVETLFVFGGNPVYDAPADLGFVEAFRKVRTRIHLGGFQNETGALSHWHVPEAHYLECWGDDRAYDGTVSLRQPLIQPLYDGRTQYEILDFLATGNQRSMRDIVQTYWRQQAPAGDFNQFWQRALHDGVLAGVNVPRAAAPALTASDAPQSGGSLLEIIFRPDSAVDDGTYTNNAWLQEMPRAMTKMVWDNAVWISPATAQKLGLVTEDKVEIEYRGRKTHGPVWVLPGHADDCITVHLGYGRTVAGSNGTEVGFNVYGIRTSDALWQGAGAAIRKVGGSHGFATTQYTYTMDEREPVKALTLAEYRRHPEVENERPPREMTLYPDWKYDGYRWGMAIDLNSCVGCQACTIACQSENNIPVVGKDQVARGRHMNWLRVDRYYHGKLDDPEVYFQPLPCMHCETAPCELVCPVGATVHSGDGLNQMVYNRCVGTRYCSNNCPYKVRRFNFYLYSDWYHESLYGLRNPDVTVRSRGVMEKCTYCVQRIAEAKIESEKEDRRIQDGEVITACAQACPTQAIIFGDLNDPQSKVAQFQAQPRNYGLLEELNTRPRTTYLARVRNPNPELERG